MAQERTSGRRHNAAVLFLSLAALALPAVLLAAGRLWGRPPPEPAGPRVTADNAFIPRTGGRWSAGLDQAGRDALMALFLDALNPMSSESTSPDMKSFPQGAGGPLFVTVYPPGRRRVRVAAKERSLPLSVAGAARQVAASIGPRLDAARLRVRMDVIAEATPMPVSRRQDFAGAQFGEPIGLAILADAKLNVFLPADVAALEMAPRGLHRTMLASVCVAASLRPEDWRLVRYPMWGLRVDGFVNAAPGASATLPSPRGLVPVAGTGPGDVRAAARQAGEYLVRSQDEAHGGFRGYRGGFRNVGCDSVIEQADAGAALALLAESGLGSDSMVAAFRRGREFVLAVGRSRTDPTGRMMFVAGDETCHEVWELETTAAALGALCRLHHAAPDALVRADIRKMAGFLLFMQRDDNLFDMETDPDSGERRTPPKAEGNVAAQARAVAALGLAFRELGLEHADCLTGAVYALKALQRADAERSVPYTSSEARWLACAILELDRNGLGRLPGNVEWMERLADARAADQLLADESPCGEELAGASLVEYPPGAGSTADDLVVFASACMMDERLRAKNLDRARRAAGYLMRLQYTPRSAYYLADPDDLYGAFRERPGNKTVRLPALAAALDGLTRLTLVMKQDGVRND